MAMKKVKLMRITLSSLFLGLLSGLGAFAAAQTPVPGFREPENPAIRLALRGAIDPLDQQAPRGSLLNLPKAFEALTAKQEHSEYRLALNTNPKARIAPDFGIDEPNQPFEPLEAETRDVNIELTLSAPRRLTGLNVDLALAPRAAFELTADGQRLRGAGAELRLGRGLDAFVRPFESPSWDNPTWYFFAAADGSALTWRPENTANTLERGLRLQEERVVVGDVQAGVSMEANGMQASLSLVKRDVTNGAVTEDESFVGATLTWRR
jgi:hypothetical protein